MEYASYMVATGHTHAPTDRQLDQVTYLVPLY